MNYIKWGTTVIALILLGGLLWFKVFRYLLPRPLPSGECTWYAAMRAKEDGWNLNFKQQYGRDARKWGDLVRNGELVGTPEVGALMILDAWGVNPYGHVAYVEEVMDAEHFTVTHANMMVGVKAFERQGVPIRRADLVVEGGSVRFEEGGKIDYPLLGFLIRRD